MFPIRIKTVDELKALLKQYTRKDTIVFDVQNMTEDWGDQYPEGAIFYRAYTRGPSTMIFRVDSRQQPEIVELWGVLPRTTKWQGSQGTSMSQLQGLLSAMHPDLCLASRWHGMQEIILARPLNQVEIMEQFTLGCREYVEDHNDPTNVVYTILSH
jgi:hypothetical protein